MIKIMDNLGRIVIPKSVREQLGISPGEEVEIELTDNSMIIKNPKKIDVKDYISNKLEELKHETTSGNFVNGIVIETKKQVYEEIYEKLK